MWRSDELLPSMPKGEIVRQLELSRWLMAFSVLALLSTRLELMSTMLAVMEIGLELMYMMCQSQGEFHGCCRLL